MITESYSKMMTDIGMRPIDYGEELGFRERELTMYRSGSAPPTVEGSLSAVGGLFHGGFAEEEIRCDPAYISYYYSNVNLNPRLPPPVLSKEDWRLAQRLQAPGGGGSIGDRRKVDDGVESRVPQHVAAEWGGDGLIGLSGLGLGSRTKSIAEIIQVISLWIIIC